MTEWIISSSVLIVVMAALRFILRGKISLRLQYALWALVLIRLLVPVSFGASPVSVMNALPDALPESAVSIGVPADAYANSETATPESSPPVSPESADVEENIQDGVSDINARVINWGSAALVVWLTGLAVVGMFLLITNLRFYVRLKSDRRMTDIPEYPLPVYVSDMVETPCMFGLFHPAIYITQEAQEDETILSHVLEHEATHYRHGDHIWGTLRCVCLALHWYNPLVWLAASLSMRDAELACDEGTIKRIGEGSRGDYGRSLVGLTCRKHNAGTLLSTATTMTGSKKSIKERIALIAKKPKTALYTIAAVILVVAAAACGTFTSVKGAALPGAEADPSSKAASVSPSTPGAGAYTIPLDAILFYGPHGIQTKPAVDEWDIAEALAEAKSDGAPVVENVPENASPSDGEVWLLHREGYEVGLRNQGDQTEILLQRDGAVTVLDSVPSNSGSDIRYSLRSFDAIPELSGFVLENLTSYGWGYCSYYAVRYDSAVCFAQSFGTDMTDIAKDLDGDGHAELICNVTYNADGVNDVFVYRMKAGIPQVADVKDAMLDIPEDKHLANMASAAYDSNTGAVTLEYKIAGEDDWRVETAPIDYGSLQFEDFTATW